MNVIYEIYGDRVYVVDTVTGEVIDEFAYPAA